MIEKLLQDCRLPNVFNRLQLSFNLQFSLSAPASENTREAILSPRSSHQVLVGYLGQFED